MTDKIREALVVRLRQAAPMVHPIKVDGRLPAWISEVLVQAADALSSPSTYDEGIEAAAKRLEKFPTKEQRDYLDKGQAGENFSAIVSTRTVVEAIVKQAAESIRSILGSPTSGDALPVFDTTGARADLAKLASRLRKGLVASAGFVRDSKNPDAIRDMQDAVNAVDEILQVTSDAYRALDDRTPTAGERGSIVAWFRLPPEDKRGPAYLHDILAEDRIALADAIERGEDLPPHEDGR